MMIDVQDATFETEILQRSMSTPVVIDLWAPWCGPCKTLGPILEKVVNETNGQVVLAKINVDENPQSSAAFRVQSIPAVYAMKDGQIVDGFMGAKPEHEIREFVTKLLDGADAEAEAQINALVAQGDEESLRQAVGLDGTSVIAVGSLAALLLSQDRAREALEVLNEGPDDEQLAPLVEAAREAALPADAQSGLEKQLAELLPTVKADEEAKARYLEILDELATGNPESAAGWRRKLASQLF